VISVESTWLTDEPHSLHVRGQLFFCPGAGLFSGWFIQHSVPTCITIDMAEARIWIQDGNAPPRSVWIRKRRQAGSSVKVLNSQPREP